MRKLTLLLKFSTRKKYLSICLLHIFSLNRYLDLGRNNLTTFCNLGMFGYAFVTLSYFMVVPFKLCFLGKMDKLLSNFSDFICHISMVIYIFWRRSGQTVNSFLSKLCHGIFLGLILYPYWRKLWRIDTIFKRICQCEKRARKNPSLSLFLEGLPKT